MIEQFLVTSQGFDTTINDCYYSVEVCIKGLLRNCTDKYFKSFFVQREDASKCDPQSYQEKGDYLMMVLLSMSLMQLRICTEKNILRLLTVLRENLKAVSTKRQLSFCKKHRSHAEKQCKWKAV